MTDEAKLLANAVLTWWEAKLLANAVLTWWEDHQFDTTGPYGDHNVYDTEPDFVKMAKAILAV